MGEEFTYDGYDNPVGRDDMERFKDRCKYVFEKLIVNPNHRAEVRYSNLRKGIFDITIENVDSIDEPVSCMVNITIPFYKVKNVEAFVGTLYANFLQLELSVFSSAILKEGD